MSGLVELIVVLFLAIVENRLVGVGNFSLQVSSAKYSKHTFLTFFLKEREVVGV